MAGANVSDRTQNDIGKTSPKTLDELYRSLEGLRDGQGQLEKQVKELHLTLNALLDAQKGLSEHIVTWTKSHLQQRSITEPCMIPTREPDASAGVGSLTMPVGPYPQFDAGRRLISTSELLELVLLELPAEDVLLAQRTNRQFRSAIAGSHRLQLRLFLTTEPSTPNPTNILLNPIISKERVLQHIPLYFDEERKALAYCHRGKRRHILQHGHNRKGRDHRAGVGRSKIF